jgi:hypothetical protein
MTGVLFTATPAIRPICEVIAAVIEFTARKMAPVDPEGAGRLVLLAAELWGTPR